MAQRKRNTTSKPAKRRFEKVARIPKHGYRRAKGPAFRKVREKPVKGVLLHGHFEGLEFVFREHEWGPSPEPVWITEPAQQCSVCGARVKDTYLYIAPCKGEEADVDV